MDLMEAYSVSYPESRLQFQPLDAALLPLKTVTRVDFADLIRDKYNVPRPFQRPGEEGQSFLTDSVSGIDDLSPYFADQPPKPRKFYRYISRHHHSAETYKKYKDYLVMEEEVKDGTVVAIVEYIDPNFTTQKHNTRQKINYRKLAACYLVKKPADGSDYQAATIYSPGHSITVGFVDKNQEWLADDQLLLLKDRQRFLIKDDGNIDWLDLPNLETKYQRISQSLSSRLAEAADQGDPVAVRVCEMLSPLSRQLLGIELTPQTLAVLLNALGDNYPFLAKEAGQAAEVHPLTREATPKFTLQLAQVLAGQIRQQIAGGANPVPDSTPADLDHAIEEIEESLSH